MLIRCSKCGQECSLPVCGGCGALQPLPQVNYFELLGLPRRYDLNRELVEERQRELSRRVHPDRFATASAYERRLSLLWSTAVNEAAKTLKDPVKRAEYMLGLEGIHVRKEQGGEAGDPTFLMEMLELREELNIAIQRNDDARVHDLAEGVEHRRKAILREIAHAFEQTEGEGDHGEQRRRIARMLQALRYLDRFLEEAHAYEEQREGAQ